MDGPARYRFAMQSLVLLTFLCALGVAVTRKLAFQPQCLAPILVFGFFLTFLISPMQVSRLGSPGMRVALGCLRCRLCLSHGLMYTITVLGLRAQLTATWLARWWLV